MFLTANATAEGINVRVGPAENPDQWPDWGGTPDLELSDDMSLSQSEIASLFERMSSPDQSARTRAVAELRRDAPGSVTILRENLFKGHGARNSEMKSAMREAARRASNEKQTLLEGLLSIDPQDSNLGSGASSALRVLAMLNGLNDLNTLAGYKVMTEFSIRHAGVFRHEIGRMLVAKGMVVMPALVYGRGSKNKEIHMFAVKWIRDLGNPLLSEQIKIKNPRRLAQLLEAYASVNEFDAIDVTLSMTNHRSIFVRNAARSALKAYGRNALWPARRQYENTFGTVPEAGFSVEDILAKLYEHYDNQRLAKSMTQFETGQRAFTSGNLEEMASAYREVLKHSPMFPKRGEMAAGFLAQSTAIDDEDEMKKKKAALRMTLRVADADSKEAKLAQAELLWIQAVELKEVGLASPEIYQRILSFNPNHKGAQALHQTLQPEKRTGNRMVPKALIVSFIFFLGSILVYFRIRSSRSH